MRVLLSALGTRGDVQPMTVLALALQQAGHRVTLCAPLDFADWVPSFGLEYRPIKVRVADQTAARMSPWAVLRMLSRAVRAELEAVSAAPGPFELFLGSGMAGAGATVAEATGVPYRFCVFCPQIVPSRHHPGPMLPWQGLPQWVNRLTWVLFNWAWDAAALEVHNTERERLGLPKSKASWPALIGKLPLIAVDPWLAPMPADAPPIAGSTGSWLAPPGPPLPAELEDFLSHGPAPIYFGFGSMKDQAPAQTTAMFVDLARRLDRRALISSGWAGLEAKGLPDSVRLIGPVDHPRLFPRCAAVVHHGGAGTTTAAAAAGVPQVLVPHLGDQFWWAHRVHQLGLGPPGLNRRRLTPARLEQALRTALSADVVGTARAGAARVSREGPDSAVRELERLVGAPAQGRASS